jgi:hypothetical protein
MNGLRLDILALFTIGPELDATWLVFYVLAHPDDVIEEMLGIEVGVLTERNVHRLYALDAIEGKIEQQEVACLRTKDKPTVAELL